MSKWITDRRPTEEDADYGDVHLDGYVYVTNERGMTRTATWKAVAYDGFPWQPIMIPEPYEKLKRFDVYLEGGSDDDKRFVIAENGWIWAAVPVMGKDGLDAERAYDTAERIAAIYEETFP